MTTHSSSPSSYHVGTLALIACVVTGLVAVTLGGTPLVLDEPFPKTTTSIPTENIPLTPASLQSAHNLAVTWLTSNLKENGSFYYQFSPASQTYTTTNNDIRQLMASRLLAELANEDPSLLPLHQKNLAYALRALYKDHGTEASVELANKSKLGGIAMLLRTFVASPYFEQYSGHAEKLANAIRSLQKADGSFHAWYKAPNYKYDEDYLLTFYSGEGILALLEYYLKTKNIKRRDIALLSQDYYLQAYVEHIEENYYPAYVPRHTISLYHAYQITQEKKYADAIFLLNNKLIDEMLHTDTTTPHYLGRFYNPQFPQYGSPHSASDGVFLEGLVYAYRLAKELGDTSHITKYKDAILLAAHNLMRLQYGKKTPTTLAGAIRISHKNPDIRIDTTQHMIDAFHVLLATDIVTQ